VFQATCVELLLVSRDAEPDLPVPERPAIVDLLQQAREEQMRSEALCGRTPPYRRLMENAIS
jgi:hypothetical protein